MAHTVALLSASQYRLLYSVTEDGTAGDQVSTDVSGDLVSGSPLETLLDDAFADQAAARTALQAARISVQQQVPGATGPSSCGVDADVSGGGAGNFRLVTTTVKEVDTETPVFWLSIEFRHSIDN